MLTEEEFDKISNEFDITKLELKDIECPSDLVGKFSDNFNFFTGFYDKKIQEIEKELENQQNGKELQVDIGNIKNDDIIKDYLEKGVISDKDIGDLMETENNNLKEFQEKKDKEDNTEQILKDYLNHLKSSKKSVESLQNFWTNYLNRIEKKREDFNKKKDKLLKLKKDKYEEYLKNCEVINKKIKQNFDRIKNTIVLDETEYNKKIKAFDKTEESKKVETDNYYKELSERKERIVKYWKFSLKNAIIGGIIGLTAPLTLGASLGAAIGVGLASSGLHIIGQSIEGSMKINFGDNYSGEVGLSW